MMKLELNQKREIQAKAFEAASGATNRAELILAGILIALGDIDYKMWKAQKDAEQARR